MAFGRLIQARIGVEGEEGLLIKDNRITFSVEKTEKKEPNKAVINIYNLTDATMEEIKKVDNSIILDVGYEDEDGLKPLFFGDITKAVILRERPGTMIQIKASDGIKNYREKNTSLSYSSGTRIRTIVQDLSNILGYPLEKKLSIDNIQFANGWSFIGKVKNALTSVLKVIDKEWSIQNKKIVILGETETLENQAIVISQATGMINSPEPLEEMGKAAKAKNKKDRFRIKSLLYPEIIPGSIVNIESEAVNGFAKTGDCTYDGDTEGAEMVCVGEYTIL